MHGVHSDAAFLSQDKDSIDRPTGVDKKKTSARIKEYSCLEAANKRYDRDNMTQIERTKRKEVDFTKEPTPAFLLPGL